MLGRGLGTVIDSFDNVLRFHEQLPHLNRHSKDVGKKTTILASNGNARSLHRLEKRLSKQKRRSGGFTKGVQELIFSVKQLSKDPDPTDVIKGTGCGKEVLQLAKDIGWPVRVWSDRSIPEEYHNFDGDPTSGMVILYNLLNEYDQIYLCGFNFFGRKSHGRSFL